MAAKGTGLMRDLADLSSSGQQVTVGNGRAIPRLNDVRSLFEKILYYGLKSIPLKNVTEVESSRKGGRSTALFEVFSASRLTRT